MNRFHDPRTLRYYSYCCHLWHITLLSGQHMVRKQCLSCSSSRYSCYISVSFFQHMCKIWLLSQFQDFSCRSTSKTPFIVIHNYLAQVSKLLVYYRMKIMMLTWYHTWSTVEIDAVDRSRGNLLCGCLQNLPEIANQVAPLLPSSDHHVPSTLQLHVRQYSTRTSNCRLWCWGSQKRPAGRE